MTTKAFFFLILIIIKASNCTQNLNCILNAFDREKIEVTKAQAALIAESNHRKAEKNKIKPKNSDLHFSDNPGGNMGHKFVKTVTKLFGLGHKEADIPISLEELSIRYMNYHYRLVSADLTRWVDQQCTPYLRYILKSYMNSHFLCNQLLQKRPNEVTFLGKYQNIAHRLFGKIFSEVANEVKRSNKNEISLLSYVTTEAQLKSGRELIETYFTKLTESFLVSFDKKIKDVIGLSSIDEIDKKFNLTPYLSILANDQKIKLEEIRNAIVLIIHSQELPKDSETVQILQNTIKEYKELLFETVNSVSFTRLADKISGKCKKDFVVKSLMDNLILPSCLLKMHAYESDLASYNILRICNDLVSKLNNANFLKPLFPIYVLEGKQSIEFIVSAINDSLLRINSDFFNNFELLPNFVLKAWLVYLKNLNDLFEPNFQQLKLNEFQTRESNFEPSNENDLNLKNIPFLLSLKDILQVANVNKRLVITPELLNEFYEETKNNIVDSTKVFNFLETSRTKIIKGLGVIGKQIKMNQFISKLESRCRQNRNSAFIELCIRIVNVPDFRKYLHYRYSDTIFDLMYSNLVKTMSPFNVKESKQDDLTRLGVSAINSQLSDFQNELLGLIKLDAFFCNSQSEVKCLMYIMIAKSVLSNPSDPIPSFLLKSVIDWGANNYQELNLLKLRNNAFDFKLLELRSYLNFKYVEEKRQRDPKFYDHLHQQSLWENAMSQSEKKELALNLGYIMQNFNALPSSIKQRVYECSLPSADVKIRMNECEIKNKGPCRHINPFVLGKKCPNGYEHDQFGNCLADCPENFSMIDSANCRKPIIVPMAAIGILDSYKLGCKANYQEEGLLCIPKCPRNWIDHGHACKRPFIRFDFSTAVLLID